jgi:hypothetical protein
MWAVNKRAATLRQQFHGSNGQPWYRRMNAVAKNSRELFFTQLSDISPAVSKILKTYPSRIRAHVTTGDAINTYGISIVFQVFVEVLMDRCKNCGETQFTAPNDACRYHKFIKEWREVASGEAKEGTERALMRADNRATEWLKKRGVDV